MASASQTIRKPNPTATLLLVMVVTALATGLLFSRSWRIDYDYSIDFQAYWLAGQRIVEGRPGDLYAAGGGPAEGTPIPLVAGEFKNIPLVATAFAPLARAPYASAKRLFWWLNFLAIAGTAAILGHWVLPHSLGPPVIRGLAAMAALALMAPTHIALRHGQTTPLITLLLAMALALALSRRQAGAGIALALSMLIKWPAWALVAADVLRGRRRASVAFSATLAAAVGLSLLLFGPALHSQYIGVMADNLGTVMTGHNNQSLAAVLTRLTSNVPVRDWTPQPLTTGARAATTFISLSLLLLVILALLHTRRLGETPRTRRLEFAALSVIGLVLLPVAWDHYFMMLFPGLVGLAAVLHRDGRLHRPASVMLLAFTFLAMALPTPTRLIDSAAAHGLAGSLTLSHYFFGAMGMLLLTLTSLWQPATLRQSTLSAEATGSEQP